MRAQPQATSRGTPNPREEGPAKNDVITLTVDGEPPDVQAYQSEALPTLPHGVLRR